MKKALCLALLCLLTALPVTGRTFQAAPAPSDWATYLQPAAGIAVSSPVGLARNATKVLPIPFAKGSVEVKFSLFFGFLPGPSDPPTMFSVAVIEPVTGKALLNLAAKERDGVMDGLPEGLAGPGGKVIRQGPFRFMDFPGREFVVRSEVGGQARRIYGRTILIGNRILALNVWGPENLEKTAGMDRFFDSFRLMTDGEKRLYGTTNAAEMIAVNAAGQEIDPSQVPVGGVIVQAAPKWLRVSSAEGGFEAEVPSRMARKRETFENSGMQITQTMLQARRDADLYYIAFVSFPESLNLEDNAQSVLASGAETGAKQIKGKVTETRKFTLDGSPGLEARILSGDGKTLIVHRGIVRKNRLYQIFVETSPKAGSEKDIARFFKSFTLKPVTKPGGGEEEETYVEADASNTTPAGPIRQSEPELRRSAVIWAVVGPRNFHRSAVSFSDSFAR